MNGDTQFTLFAEDIHARVDIFPLFQRVFSLSWLSADNLKFRMRVQHEGERAHAPRVAAFPPLHGLPGVNTVSVEEASQTEKREAPWTVRLRNLGVTVTELWFFEYRYLGEGKLKGGFKRGPDVLKVRTSVQKLGPGKLLYGEDHVISHNFRGQIEAEIPEVNPSEHADLSFFDFVNAHIDLRGDIVNLEHVSEYLPNGEVRKGEGHLTILGVLRRGALSDDTTVAFETDEVEFVADGIHVRTDVDFLIDMARAQDTAQAKDAAQGPAPRLRSHSKATYVTFSSDEMDPVALEVRGHTERAALASSQLDEEMRVVSATLEVPSIVSDDVKGLGSRRRDVEKSDSGRATAGLYLAMDENGRFHGPFHADLQGVEFEVPPVKMAMNGRLKFQASVDLEHETLMLSGIEADARDVDFKIGKRRIEDWWLTARGKRIWLDWANGQLNADASLSSKNAEPMIRAVAHGKGGLPQITADLLKFPDVRSAAKLRLKGDTLDLMLEDLKTDFVDFSGRVFRRGESLQLALLVGGEAISLGLYKDPKTTTLSPMANAQWLNRKLALFPKPKERVAAPKP